MTNMKETMFCLVVGRPRIHERHESDTQTQNERVREGAD